MRIGDGGKVTVLFKIERLVLGEGMIGKENAFKMVIFVKDDASFEMVENLSKLLTFLINGFNFDLSGAENWAV